MNKLYRYITSPRRSTRDLSTNILITILLAFAFTLINPNFIGSYNLLSIGQNFAPYAILSLGVLFPVSMGGIDLSTGTTCVGAAVVAGKLYELGMPLGLVIPVMILFGFLVGLANGAIISKYHIQPFIVTLGSMMFVRGITAILAAKPSILYPSGCWYNHLFSNFHGIPMGILWVAALTLCAYFIFRRTKYGRYFVSIGSNEKATRISGVDIERVKCVGYAISGMMAGIAGIFWSASFATVSVATGNGMELDAVAGVYIGGTSALGGMANVWGTLIGSLMLVLVRSGLNFALARLNVNINSTYMTYVISGLIVVAAVLIERMRESDFGRRKQKKAPSETRTVVTRCICAGLSVVMTVFLVLTATRTISLNGLHAGREQKTICLLMKSEGQDFWDSVARGAIDAGQEKGYRVVCRGTESEDPSFLPKQLELAESLLSENPVGLGMSTIANGFTNYLANVYKSGIPVIQFDSGLYPKDVETMEASDHNPLVASVKADNYANAELAAERTFAAVRDDIAGSSGYVVGIIRHDNSESAAHRSGGFADRFAELAEADPQTAGKVTVITETKPSAADNAYKAALELLYEKGADLVFGTNQFAAHQMIDAIEASGDKYDGMKFAVYDSSEKVAEWLRKESGAKLIGVVDQNPYMIGKYTAETIIRAAEGETVEKEILVSGIWYDRENIDTAY